MGVSYIAAFFVPGVAPKRLYDEAFASLHKRMGLPAIERTGYTLSLWRLSQHVNVKVNGSDRDLSENEMDVLLSETTSESGLRLV
jgi:hypothetical protein